MGVFNLPELLMLHIKNKFISFLSMFRLGQLGATANSAKVWFANGLALAASFGLYIFV
jgi:hypothetical protein